MKKSRRVLSIVSLFSIFVALFSSAVMSASAAIDENGRYVPSEGVENTLRYYFCMPEEWKNEYSTEAGVYWWFGSDTPDGDFIRWPGYKAQVGNFDNLFYIDCPDDVEIIIWNNYVDGGDDTSQEIYLKAFQTGNLDPLFYGKGDSKFFDKLDDGNFFENMEESYYGDKKALGDFADNFFIDEEKGFSFNFDNMIYVVDIQASLESESEGYITYIGEWNFYYDDGTYGPYPTKEASVEAGKLGSLNADNTPTEPTEEPTEPTEEPTEPTEEPTEPTEAPTVAPTMAPTASSTVTPTEDQTEEDLIPEPETQDATSAKEEVNDTASNDTATPDNAVIQTGAISFIAVFLVVIATLFGGLFYVRRRYE